MRIRAYWRFSFAGIALLFQILPVRAAPAVIFEGLQVEYSFGQQITFVARINSELPVAEVLGYIQIEGDPNPIVNQADFNADGRVKYVYDLSQNPLRAFSQVEYWFVALLEDGQEFSSQRTAFVYEDNRFKWEDLERQPFRIHWYQGDRDFAESVLNVAEEGLQKVQSLLRLQVPSQVDIYVYASSAEMQATQLMKQDWVAGRADVDLKVMAISLPGGPGQALETRRQVPHELMHISLFHSMGDRYFNLPVWFNEGLASITELYPNPDHQVLLENARSKQILISIDDLCKSFPSDASGALLAYAESAYFTRYLQQHYGQAGLESLVQAYADGVECEQGVEVVLGSSLSQLDQEWRNEVFSSPAPQASAGALLPWFGVLFVALLFPLVLTVGGLKKPKTQAAQAGSVRSRNEVKKRRAAY